MGSFTTREFVVKNDKLFKDENFNMALPAKYKGVSWSRPHAISQDPIFFFNKPCVCDLKQGNLGNCYFISALHSIIAYYTIQHPNLLCNLLYQLGPWQSFQVGYSGSFTFLLWNGFGWQAVVIDDLLPTCNNKLLFTYNTHGEYWPQLMEKAVLSFLNMSYEDSDKGGVPATIFKLFYPSLLSMQFIMNPSIHDFEQCLEDKNLLCTIAYIPNFGWRRRSTWLNINNLNLHLKRRQEELLECGLYTYHAYGLVSHKSKNSTRSHIGLVINPWQKNDDISYSRDIIDSSQLVNFSCELCACAHDESDGRWLMTKEQLSNHFNLLYICSITTPYIYFDDAVKVSTSFTLSNILNRPVVVYFFFPYFNKQDRYYVNIFFDDESNPLQTIVIKNESYTLYIKNYIYNSFHFQSSHEAIIFSREYYF